MTPIQNRRELAEALAQPRALLFLWVNWAVHAANSRTLISKLVAEQSAPCYMADVSNQCGEVWDGLAEWLTAEGLPAGRLMMSGAGPLLWLRSGHVVLHVAAPLEHGAAKLMAVNRSVFASEPKQDSPTL